MSDRKTLTIISVFLLIWAVGGLVSNLSKKPAQESPRIDDPFSNPYRIEILNEAEARLISKYDTVTLLMENAYALSDETVIFIKRKP